VIDPTFRKKRAGKPFEQAGEFGANKRRWPESRERVRGLAPRQSRARSRAALLVPNEVKAVHPAAERGSAVPRKNWQSSGGDVRGPLTAASMGGAGPTSRLDDKIVAPAGFFSFFSGSIWRSIEFPLHLAPAGVFLR